MDVPDVADTGVSRVSPTRPVVGMVFGILLALAATGVLLPVRDNVSKASPALVLVVPVVVAGIVGGRLAAVVTALIGAAAFDLAFIPPVGSLPVAIYGDAVALLVFVIVAILVGTMAATEARRRRSAEQRSRDLLIMHRRLADVTAERERLWEERGRIQVLEQVDRQRSALLRSVSHDLRTPLAAIRAIATELRDDVGYPAAERARLLGVVGDQAQRLDRLVANLLSLGRIEAGALRPVRKSVDLPDLLAETVEPLRALFAPTILEVRTDRSIPLVPADYVLVEQVVTNLVENAVRHSPPGTAVAIGASAGPEGWVTVTVTDCGPGIDPAERALIFEPFRTGTASQSTGVGLAICRGIIEAHGGRIDARPAPGGGAELTFSLPLVAAGEVPGHEPPLSPGRRPIGPEEVAVRDAT